MQIMLKGKKELKTRRVDSIWKMYASIGDRSHHNLIVIPSKEKMISNPVYIECNGRELVSIEAGDRRQIQQVNQKPGIAQVLRHPVQSYKEYFREDLSLMLPEHNPGYRRNLSYFAIVVMTVGLVSAITSYLKLAQAQPDAGTEEAKKNPTALAALIVNCLAFIAGTVLAMSAQRANDRQQRKLALYYKQKELLKLIDEAEKEIEIKDKALTSLNKFLTLLISSEQGQASSSHSLLALEPQLLIDELAKALDKNDDLTDYENAGQVAECMLFRYQLNHQHFNMTGIFSSFVSNVNNKLDALKEVILQFLYADLEKKFFRRSREYFEETLNKVKTFPELIDKVVEDEEHFQSQLPEKPIEVLFSSFINLIKDEKKLETLIEMVNLLKRSQLLNFTDLGVPYSRNTVKLIHSILAENTNYNVLQKNVKILGRSGNPGLMALVEKCCKQEDSALLEDHIKALLNLLENDELFAVNFNQSASSILDTGL